MQNNFRVNLGCGGSPTPGWLNIDNSPTVWLARFPLADLIPGKRKFIKAIKMENIVYGDAQRITLPDSSVDVLYTSHMLEHLDREEAGVFFKEARRVLRNGGILRIAVPDLNRLVKEYLRTGDAEKFLEACHMAVPKPRGFIAKLRYSFFSGFRHHHWMYDAPSIHRALTAAGFVSIHVRKPGETIIPNPGALDLREREDESLYVEAVR